MYDLTTKTTNAMDAAMRTTIDVRCSDWFALGAPAGDGIAA
jgi:hypothetical protein